MKICFQLTGTIHGHISENIQNCPNTFQMVISTKRCTFDETSLQTFIDTTFVKIHS